MERAGKEKGCVTCRQAAGEPAGWQPAVLGVHRSAGILPAGTPASSRRERLVSQSDSLRAIRLLRPNTPLIEQDLRDPMPGPGEILIDIRASGICHSDAHYRAGGRTICPITLGHEIAGVVADVGEDVEVPRIGDRVAVHYLAPNGAMIGKDRDGGFAEQIVIPARNAVPIPDEVPFDHAAIMMCSTATAYHALNLAALRHGESVAILGFGGLGASACQLAGLRGAGAVIAVDVVAEKFSAAREAGAATVDAARMNVREGILNLTGGRGADVALDFAGHAATTTAALRALAPGGRLILVAINLGEFTIDAYRDVLSQERRIIGCSDHLYAELLELMELARTDQIDPASAITRTAPLDATAINEALDDLERGTPHLRTVLSF
jgi:propanol-preferring alcohol dehydrogenase